MSANPAGVIDHLLTFSEKTDEMMAEENKLQLIVHVDATKPEIRDAVEALYDVRVEGVNTMVTMQGTKKATVQLSEDDDALDIAARAGGM